MRIGSITPQAITTVKSGNTTISSNSNGSGPLQKMLLQLQEQIKKVEESDATADTKNEQIKALQEQIQKLQEQISREKLEKSTEKKEPKKEDIQTEKLREDGFTLVDKDFVSGIVASSSSMKLAATAHTQYVAAKARHDEAAMSRSLEYQASNSAQAQKAIEKIEVHKTDIVNKTDAKADEKAAENTESTTSDQIENGQSLPVNVENIAQNSNVDPGNFKQVEPKSIKTTDSVSTNATVAYRETVKASYNKQKRASFDISI